MKDKRKYPRVSSLNLSYVCIDEKENIINEGMGRTLDVSEAGIRLETNFFINPGQMLSLTIAIEDNLLDVKGKVVYSESDADGVSRAGVEFTELNESSRDVLKKFVQFFQEQIKENL